MKTKEKTTSLNVKGVKFAKILKLRLGNKTVVKATTVQQEY